MPTGDPRCPECGQYSAICMHYHPNPNTFISESAPLTLEQVEYAMSLIGLTDWDKELKKLPKRI